MKIITIKDKGLIAIGACWLLMQIFLFVKNGIVVDGEPEKYISNAKHLLATGSLQNASFCLYLTEIILIAAAMKLQLGFGSVVVFQMLLNGIALLAFYKMASRFVSSMAAAIGTLFLTINYPFQEFNTFLQTESIFFSLCILLSAYLLSLKRLSVKNGILISLGLILISITRPTGILFAPPILLYLFFRFFQQIKFWWKIGIVVTGLIGFLIVLNYALGSGGELDFMLPYRDERIICGVPTLPGFIPINEAPNGNSLYGLLYYVVHNFGQFTKLALLRSGAFFGLMRSYYSTGHNIYLVICYYMIYIFVFLSLKRFIKKFKYEFFYFVLLIAMTWITVMLSCDDWHNRFFLSVFPFVLLMSLPFVDALMQKNIIKRN